MTESIDKKDDLHHSPFEFRCNRDGHPIAHLWVTSTAVDGYFFVFLEDVGKNGASNYVSDRGIRASRRALHSSSPWNDLVSLP